MRYVAAYLLAVLGGNAAPSNSDIENILSSVGTEADSTRVTKVVNELKGKSIEELIAPGREKLSSMPAGGGATVAAPAAAGGGGGAAAPAAEKKDEKKEESESDDEDIRIFGLFE
ncbi:60S acidic ribosomal protein P2-like [Anopheles maculipalpis]|uniref:60S acidic ribosomal protein P2-like n=1 Tax=Anopheles maculipalpis TaxID=1496333 RepID=UPI00215954BE|nr:60S acidic ribosomal protein P2-like [Anopheles maculipalpis]